VNVWHLLATTAKTHPEQPALRQGTRELDYGSAARTALALAAVLRQRGIAAGDRVACLMHNHIEHYLAYFAVAVTGGVLVSLNTRLQASEQRQILRHSGTQLLLCDEAHRQRAAELAADCPRGVLEASLPLPESPGFEPSPAAADSPAQLYYTSGTTGDPKGVILTHRNVCTHAAAAIQELQLGPSDRWAHIAPMFHLADAWATFAITQVGGVHAFLPQFQARAALDLLADEKITITNLVPTMLNLMVREPDAAQRQYNLRTMLSGGAPIAPEVVRRILDVFRCDYVQTYGMTETSPYLTLSLLTPAVQQLPPEQQLRWKCKTGRPFHGVQLEVVGDDGQPVAADARTVGEVRVQGPTVTPGYWQNPAATAAAFDAEGFLRTGDLATIDIYGYIDIVDRKKDVIKTGGEAVYSVEVEHVLYEHPAVLECAVFGQPDPLWGERVCAAVVLRHAGLATAEDLIEHCRARMAHYKAPKQIRFLSALPRTGSGKITKKALRDHQV